MTHKNPLFSGFATNISSKQLFDNELVKQDLLNHINTRKGERVMDPEYGSIIWDLLFELQTEFITNEIQRDLTRIIESEPRVTLDFLEIVVVENGYLGNIILTYNELDITEEFTINFNRRISDTTDNN